MARGVKTTSFYRASAIRQQARAGRSTSDLAATFGLDTIAVENILACRTREAAAQVLDTKVESGVVRRFMLSEGVMVEFTNLIRSGE